MRRLGTAERIDADTKSALCARDVATGEAVVSVRSERGSDQRRVESVGVLKSQAATDSGGRKCPLNSTVKKHEKAVLAATKEGENIIIIIHLLLLQTRKQERNSTTAKSDPRGGQDELPSESGTNRTGTSAVFRI